MEKFEFKTTSVTQTTSVEGPNLKIELSHVEENVNDLYAIPYEVQEIVKAKLEELAWSGAAAPNVEVRICKNYKYSITTAKAETKTE